MNRWESALEQGIQFCKRQFFHAAFESWSGLEAVPGLDRSHIAKLHSYCGIAYAQLGDYAKAGDQFSIAVAHADGPESKAKYTMNLAMAHRLSDTDRAYRLLMEILGEDTSGLTQPLLGLIYANLSDIQWLNGFYEEGLTSARQSLGFFESSQTEGFRKHLLHNMGVFHLELGQHSSAEEFLQKAHALESSLATTIELSRLHYRQGQIEKSIEYTNESFPLVWSSVIGYEKDEVARLCRLLADLARSAGESSIALRLIEKSQLLFGQIGMWQEWMNTQTVMDEWASAPVVPPNLVSALSLENIHRFLNLLDVMNAQEFINEQFSQLLDARVLYASALAEAMNLDLDEQRDLIYACRFADYGLTAVESEVLSNPTRSTHTWNQYTQHPTLSVKMLESLVLKDSVLDIIRDHHEAVDGTGYPNRKKGSDVSRLAQVLAVADYYASGVTIHNKPHSVVLREIGEASGGQFNPAIVSAFIHMFDVTEE